MADFGFNRRQVYRLRYPLRERPVFESEKIPYPVVDLSETGLRFFTRERAAFQIGQKVEGELVLLDNAGRRHLEGTVVRINLGGVALRLSPDTQIPLAMMMREQQRLIQKGLLDDLGD